MTDEPETQDLGVAKPAVPDQNWARTQPMFIAPSKERLDRKHQLVSIKNTSDVTVTASGRPSPQKHIVIDRYNQGHELEPGEVKHNIDMLADDIEYFIRERMPDRRNHLNRPKPIHPIQIMGYDANDLRSEPEPAPVRESVQRARPESVQRERPNENRRRT
jgi:hypothetical protein